MRFDNQKIDNQVNISYNYIRKWEQIQAVSDTSEENTKKHEKNGNNL